MLQNSFQILFVVACLGTFLLLLGWALSLRRKNAALVQKNAEALCDIVSNADGGIIAVATVRNFPVQYVNNGFLELVGYTREAFEALNPRELTRFAISEDIPRIETAISNNEADGTPIALEIGLLRKDGHCLAAMLRGTLTQNDTQRILYCVVVDISKQRAIIEKLRLEKERYRVVIELSNDIIFEVDMQKQTLCCSPRFREKFGWEMESQGIQKEMPYPLRVHPDDEMLLKHTVEELLIKGSDVSSRLRIYQEEGGYLWCRLLVTCIRHDGKALKLIGKIEDIDDFVRENQRLEILSQTDALCGLYNKEALREAVENSLKAVAESGCESAFFFIDSDNFKTVNDTLGHTAGDRVLQNIAAALKSIFRSNDIIGRFGGDEFCVFIPKMTRDVAETKATEIVQHLRGVCTGENGKSVEISASVGVACSPDAGTSYSELLSNADKATYRAKALGRNRYQIYSSADAALFASATPDAHPYETRLNEL